MGSRFIDMVGQRFERLVVVEHLGRHHHGSLWLCRCDCGNETRTSRSNLVKGTAKSCGCYRSDRMATLMYKHGERGGDKRQKASPEYKAWDGIKQRCFNPADKAWEWYGGRGVAMCPAWRDDFQAFLEHIGPRPSARHSVDRIDGSRGYEPGNVRWADWNQQANNRKNNRVVVWGGRPMSMKQAADAAGMPYKSVKSRVQAGWDVIDALTTPLNMNKVNAKRNPRKAQRST